MTMLAGDSSGWQKTNSPNVRDLDALALAETCGAKGDWFSSAKRGACREIHRHP